MMLNRKKWLKFFLYALVCVVMPISLTKAIARVDVSDYPFIIRSNAYDYAPAAMRQGSQISYWWCALGCAANKPGCDYITNPGDGTDTIWYNTYDLNTSTWGTAHQVFEPDPNNSFWDKAFVCDPSVIKGQFYNPGDYNTYSYDMYYGGTYMAENSGTDCHIGVAFSNSPGTEGQWVRYRPAPGSPTMSLISPKYAMGYDPLAYGAGQPTAYNVNSTSGTWLLYTDTTNSSYEQVFLVGSPDGINFGTPAPISTNGILGSFKLGPTTNPDFAFDPVGRYWYAAFASVYGRPGDRERYQFGLYRMPVPTGVTQAGALITGTWQSLGFVSTLRTGKDNNLTPAIVRDQFGNVTSAYGLPNVDLVFGAGDGAPSITAPLTWDIYTTTVVASPSTDVLKRYINHVSGRHWVNVYSSYVPSGYVEETSTVLGSVYSGQQQGTVPLWACENHYDPTDQFISTDINCEDPAPIVPGFNRSLGVLGFAATANDAASSLHQIYRCYVRGTGTCEMPSTSDHFVSTDPFCESAGGGCIDAPPGQVYSLGWVPW